MTAAHVTYVYVPTKIVSEANMREHWRKVSQRKASHRSTASAWLRAKDIHKPAPPCTITLTRVAPRVLDDDNLASGFKAFRDGVADWLGIDDGDKRLTWRYAQRKGKPKEYAAEVLIETAMPCPA